MAEDQHQSDDIQQLLARLQEVIALAKQGDRQAKAQVAGLLRDCRRQVHKWADYWLRGKMPMGMDRSDFSQEMLLRLVQKPESFGGEGKTRKDLERRLRRSLRNYVIQQVRAQNRQRRDASRATDAPASRQDTGEDALLRREVAAAIDQLGPRQRQALVAQLEGLSVVDIGAELGCDPKRAVSTAGSLLRKAKGKLRRRFSRPAERG